MLIDYFDFDLTKLETMCNLLDAKYNKRVKSLTAGEVVELDELAEKLGLDHFRFKYFERTRLNNQIPLTVRGEFYGIINPSDEQFKELQFKYLYIPDNVSRHFSLQKDIFKSIEVVIPKNVRRIRNLGILVKPDPRFAFMIKSQMYGKQFWF